MNGFCMIESIRLPTPARELKDVDVFLGTHDHLDHIDHEAWKIWAKTNPNAKFIFPAAHEFLDRDPVTGFYPYLQYIIEIDGVRIHHAGDTPRFERKPLRNIAKFQFYAYPFFSSTNIPVSSGTWNLLVNRSHLHRNE